MAMYEYQYEYDLVCSVYNTPNKTMQNIKLLPYQNGYK